MILEEHDHQIFTLDAEYVRPYHASIHLICENGRVALFDTGTNESVVLVQEALKKLGLGNEAVDYVIPSHVHLDHAGGAGAMMSAFTQAQLVVHPRGARHMIDPSKLWEGVCQVYGNDKAQSLYGQLLPVPAERVIEAGEGMKIDLGGRLLEVMDTPGHARHHICLYDERSNGTFTGDIFGLGYRELQHSGRGFVFPTTSPVQFDPDEMHKSVDRIAATGSQYVYVTHFGQIGEVSRLAGDLHRLIDAHVAIALKEKGAVDTQARHSRMRSGVEELLRRERERYSWPLSEAAVFELFSVDIELNAQGLAVWLDNQG